MKNLFFSTVNIIFTFFFSSWVYLIFPSFSIASEFFMIEMPLCDMKLLHLVPFLSYVICLYILNNEVKRLITYDDASTTKVSLLLILVCTMCCKATIKPLDKFRVVISSTELLMCSMSCICVYVCITISPFSYFSSCLFLLPTRRKIFFHPFHIEFCYHSVSIWAWFCLSTWECNSCSRERCNVYMCSQ